MRTLTDHNFWKLLQLVPLGAQIFSFKRKKWNDFEVWPTLLLSLEENMENDFIQGDVISSLSSPWLSLSASSSPQSRLCFHPPLSQVEEPPTTQPLREPASTAPSLAPQPCWVSPHTLLILSPISLLHFNLYSHCPISGAHHPLYLDHWQSCISTLHSLMVHVKYSPANVILLFENLSMASSCLKDKAQAWQESIRHPQWHSLRVSNFSL